MKIDTALYNNEKRHQLEGYFIIDTILSLSHPGTLGVSYPPVHAVGTCVILKSCSIYSVLVLGSPVIIKGVIFKNIPKIHSDYLPRDYWPSSL